MSKIFFNIIENANTSPFKIVSGTLVDRRKLDWVFLFMLRRLVRDTDSVKKVDRHREMNILYSSTLKQFGRVNVSTVGDERVLPNMYSI